MPINVNKSLRNWAFVTTDKIRERIIFTDTIDTGDLLASIKSHSIQGFEYAVKQTYL